MSNQFQEPIDFAGPAIGLPMSAGRTLRHLINNMGFFDVGVILEPGNRVQILDTNDLLASDWVAIGIEDNIKHHSLASLEHALAEIDAVPVIHLVGMAEYGDVR